MRYRRKNYVIYICIFSFVVVLLSAWLVFGRDGLLDLFRMQRDKERYLAAIEQLKENNRLLAAEIRRLRGDRQYLESVARKELGLVKDNEVIYRLRDDRKGTSGRHEGRQGERR